MTTGQRFTLTELLSVIAIVQGDRERLASVFRAYPDLIHATNQHGKTLLHFAAELGQVSLASFLIGQGADLCLTDAEGNTPVDAALAAGHTHLAESLMEIVQEVEPQAGVSERAGEQDADPVCPRG